MPLKISGVLRSVPGAASFSRGIPHLDPFPLRSSVPFCAVNAWTRLALATPASVLSARLFSAGRCEVAELTSRNVILPISTVDVAVLAEAIKEARGSDRRGGSTNIRARRQVTAARDLSCSSCGLHKPRDAFYRKGSSSHGVASQCMDCARAYRHYYYRTLRGNVRRLLSSARQRAKLRNHECVLTLDDILDMLWAQHGRCYYSNVPMEFLLPLSHWRMSLERLDNAAGYYHNNVVLIAGEFNTSDYSRNSPSADVHGPAQWTKQKVNDVFTLRASNVDIIALRTEIQEARGRARFQGSRTRRRPVVNDVGAVLCKGCGDWKASDAFHRNHAAKLGHVYRCMCCMRVTSRDYRRTFRGKVTFLCGSARQRSQKRGQVCTLNRNDILDMLWVQGGRCYYSGVPMEYLLPNSHWRMSLERLDNTLGYGVDNCVLIASEFNTPDHSLNSATSEVHGTAQWSRQKVNFVWGPSISTS